MLDYITVVSIFCGCRAWCHASFVLRVLEPVSGVCSWSVTKVSMRRSKSGSDKIPQKSVDAP